MKYTEEKIKLLKEVKIRGFKSGVEFYNSNIYDRQNKKITITDFEPRFYSDVIDVLGIGPYYGRHTIYSNGKWAKIVNKEIQYEIY